MVKFGLLGGRRDFQEQRQLACLAEECGFDGFFLPEHHQQPLWPSAPLVELAAIAACTSRLRLGTAVSVPALYHPVRLAEEAATLDSLSGGRLTLGLGLGYQPRDFQAFAAPASRRVSALEEAVAVLRGVWAEDGFSFPGQLCRLENVSIYPKPKQMPGPALWLAAWTLEGVRRAARLGDAWLSDPILALPAITALADAYREASTQVGRRPSVVLMRQVALAGSRDEARRLYGQAVAAMWRYYWHNRSFNYNLEPHWLEIEGPDDVTFDLAAPDRVLWGSPEDCREQLQRWLSATAADYVILAFTPSPGGHRALLDTVRLFADRVIAPLATP